MIEDGSTLGVDSAIASHTTQIENRKALAQTEADGGIIDAGKRLF
jgi:hypothetical protein